MDRDSSADGMPAWSVRLMAEWHQSDERAIAVAKPLTVEQLNWKPSPGQWSVGQCLEHLCIANEVYLPAISRALVDPPSGAVHDITPGWFSRWFIRRYIAPSPETRHARAPAKIAPGSAVDATILHRFLRSNEAARELTRRASGHNVNRTRFMNPFVPVIWFTVGTGLEIVSKHEQRHLLQAERVRESLH